MREANPFNPAAFGGGLAEQMIGKSYEVIKRVYDNLSYIKAVACNIGLIRASAANIYRDIASLTGQTGALGTTSFTEIPDGIPQEDIMDYSVLVVGSDFAVYNAAEGHFSSRIFDGQLEVTLASDAPAVLAHAEIRWTLSYRK